MSAEVEVSWLVEGKGCGEGGMEGRAGGGHGGSPATRGVRTSSKASKIIYQYTPAALQAIRPPSQTWMRRSHSCASTNFGAMYIVADGLDGI